jgi:outer membrane protein TolC
MEPSHEPARPRRPGAKCAVCRRVVAAVALAVLGGCASEESRVIETTYGAGTVSVPAGSQAAAVAAPGLAAAGRSSSQAPTNALKAPAITLQPRVKAKPDSRDVNVKTTASDGPVTTPSPLVMPPPEAVFPIDLATALRLADISNPTIGAARTMILEALGLQLAARTLLLPSLNSGASYHNHTGFLERASGKIISVSLQSLFVGSGAQAVTTGTPVIPGVNIFSQLTDAWFEPLAARQRLFGAQFGAAATSYDILLDVALLHIALLGNESILEAQRQSETEFHEVYRLTKQYFDVGEGREADANRALSQWDRQRALVQKAEEDLAVTAARLARLLNLDTAVRLEPIGGPLVPLELVDMNSDQVELIQTALAQRPDIKARTAAIGEAQAHYKQEIARPLLPTLWLGFSGGVFGGGSNLVPPLVGNFAGRTDFDVRVYWTLLNMGAGNLSLIRARNAEIGQTIAQRARTINRARDEVSASVAQARAASNQIEVARRELAAAELAFKQDYQRTFARGAAKARDVLPIELLNSLDLLRSARVNLIRAVVLYDQSQYRLWVALGAPPPLGTPPTAIRLGGA